VNIESMVSLASRHGASDLHLEPGLPPTTAAVEAKGEEVFEIQPSEENLSAILSELRKRG
jgi:hypothetical protein